MNDTPGSSPVRADLEARWVPSAEQLDLARKGFEDGPVGKEGGAVAPIALPDKEHGCWELGQAVVQLPVVFPYTSDDEYRSARDQAEIVAAKTLGERPGTVSYANISPDLTWAVFEDILPPAVIIGWGRDAG